MKKASLLLITLSYALSTSSLFAARVYVESSTTTAREVSATALTVKLDTEGTTVNTVEGSLVFVGMKDRILDIHTGDSGLTLWPNKPSLSGNVISFTGGEPNGVQGSDLTLFTVIAEPQIADTSYIDFKNIFIYTNEQEDSPISLTQQPVLVSSLSRGNVIEPDTTKPLPFSIEIARDDALFEGKHFISFVTQDSGTGINYYEVQEGDNPPLRSGSPYVLQDQSLASTIIVTAVDNSGNTQSVTLRGASFPWGVLIAILFVLGSVILYIRKK